MKPSLLPGGSALEVLETCSQEEEKRRFDARPSVNLLRELSKTDYFSRIKLEKWSEKVGALDTILTCGGEKPYKLEKPSSSVSYAELISDLKKLLAHTHYLVSSKAMAVLSMLAEGVGDKIFPNLRLTLTVLLDLSKDKKLTFAAGKCLDSLFGNVLSFDHLMEKDDAIPSAVSELKQKNALSRTAALEYLKRCVERREKAGPRGSLSTSNGVQIALLAASKVKDSDPATRKVAIEILRLLLYCDAIADKSKIQHVLEELKTSDSRVYKSLFAEGVAPRSKRIVLSQMSPDSPSKSIKNLPKVLCAKVAASPSQKALSDKHHAVQTVPSRPIDDGDHATAKLENSLAVLSQLSLLKWDDDEESGGILAGLKM
jgi:cytoskeleton-associated protein 5